MNFPHAGLVTDRQLTLTPDVYEMFTTMLASVHPMDVTLRYVFAEVRDVDFGALADSSGLATVPVPVLALVADDDAIALSHTCLLYESIPAAARGHPRCVAFAAY